MKFDEVLGWRAVRECIYTVSAFWRQQFWANWSPSAALRFVKSSETIHKLYSWCDSWRSSNWWPSAAQRFVKSSETICRLLLAWFMTIVRRNHDEITTKSRRNHFSHNCYSHLQFSFSGAMCRKIASKYVHQTLHVRWSFHYIGLPFAYLIPWLNVHAESRFSVCKYEPTVIADVGIIKCDSIELSCLGAYSGQYNAAITL